MSRNAWISVKETFPHEYELKVIFAAGRVESGKWHDKHRQWYDSKGMYVKHVTHWQDPPEPPTDPADVELERILEKAMQLRQKWYTDDWRNQRHSQDGIGSFEDAETVRLQLLHDTITEIKAWKVKFP